ncbi:MAG: glycoside hydrolase family 25 protein [Clostridiales bacterium]|nr:glycoside hydrolase family 25 protein [Clostridiales bacterium]
MKKKRKKNKFINKFSKRLNDGFTMTKSELKKIIIILIVLISLSFIVFFIYKSYLFNNTYGGLGDSKDMPICEYDLSKLKNDKNGYMSYEDDRYKSRLIIDVSSHNGEIDWNKVKESGVDGAMIRLGYRGYGDATIVEDECFQKNIAGAKNAGLKVGVYFFSQATTPEEAIEEAEYVTEKIWGRGVSLPVAFDMEPFMGNERFLNHDIKSKTEMADAFLKVISKFGYEPILYGNPTWLTNDVDISKLTEYPIWLAHYTYSTEWPNMFRMWQFTSQGRVNGISGDVDLNIIFDKK